MKKLASSSTWTSPFRGSTKSKNMIKEFKDENSVSQLTVPKKFATHQVLDEEKSKQKAAASDASAAKSDKTSASDDKEATTATGAELAAKDADDDAEEADSEERPLTETEKAEQPDADEEEDDNDVEVEKFEAAAEKHDQLAAEKIDEVKADIDDKEVLSGDDDIEQQVKETPIELVVQPEAKYEPVELPNQAVLDSLQDKPNLLNRYQELNAAAIGSTARNLDDPNKLVDLGSGLKLTQQQLLDIAAKRVAPVIANINEEVEKSRQEDSILEKRDLDSKVALHQAKLDKDLEKHKGKISKIRSKFDLEIVGKLTNIANKVTLATTSAEEFETNTKRDIETANTEYEEREKKAVEQHEVDKETLIKNHEELTTTKKQALEDAKTNQEKTTTAIEELQEKKSELDNHNSLLSSEIDELTEQLNERTKELDDLKEKLSGENAKYLNNEAAKEELNTSIITTKKSVEEKKSSHAKLAAEVGVLGGVVASYAAKLTSLKSDKESRSTRLADAKDKYTNWQKEKSDLAEKTARDHEQKRLDALHASETERVQKEIEEHKQKLEEEKKKYEEEREQLEKEAQERREAEELKRKEEEEKFVADEQKRKEEYLRKLEEEEKAKEEERKKQEEEEKKKEAAKLEELRLANDPEHQRLLRIQKRDEEKQKLLEEQTEKERIYNERKQKEQEEYESLQKEIEELKLQRDARALSAKEEAENLAQSKLDEIEKLREEHDAKVELYKQRLEFEALQKQRLEEEVANLRKIRELREEKARLATEVHGDPGLESIQKLIEERELEVTRLTKQIEFDDDEVHKALNSKSARPMNAPIESKEKELSSSKSHTSGLIAGLGGAAAGAGIATAAGASKGASATGHSASNVASSAIKSVTPTQTSGSKATQPVAKSTTPTPRDRSGSLGRTKSLSNKLKGILGRNKEEKVESAKPEAKTVTAAPKTASSTSKSVPSNGEATKTEKLKDVAPAASQLKSVDLSKQPQAQSKTAAVTHDDQRSESSGEWISVYEEVSDDEYDQNKGNPNYLEVSADEADKYLKKKKVSA